MKSFIVRILLSALFVVLLIVGTIASIFVYFNTTLPKISSLQDYRPSIASQILAKDGTVLAEIGVEKRDIVPIDDIPQIIIDSFLMAEDATFYEHKGIDYTGIFRAFLANIKAGKVVQGGSTITQQVAKSLLLTRERALSRKIKDFLLAQKIEKRLSKKEILYLYLNQIYLGGGYYGIKAAFKGYFDKKLDEATIAEAAMVTGLVVAPGRYSPYINARMARARQDYVLHRLYQTNRITKEEYFGAREEKIKFYLRKKSEFLAGHFTDWIRQKVVGQVGKDKFLTEGFRVQTTLDYDLQKIAEQAVAKGIAALDKRQGFKGPLKRLDEGQTMEEFFLEQRKELYLEQSSYFTINEDFTRKYEIEYEPQEFDDIRDHNAKFRAVLPSRTYVPGYHTKDKVLKYLKKNQYHEAVVLQTNDRDRIIHISVMGIPGIIPYEHFQWAHKRHISEEYRFYPKITRPSTILKRKDIVLVKIASLSTKLLPHVHQVKKSRYAKLSPKRKKEIKKQRYLLCSLEQNIDAEGALLALKPDNGEVIAMVGGLDFKKSQFNRAIQAKRQPGSAFKPILFAAALENGMTPSSIIIDSPETLAGVDDTLNWKPRNYDGKFKGPVTLRNALEQSRNIPTIKIADKLGIKRILSFVDRIGLRAKLEKDLSLSLGSFGVTLMDIVSVYGIFPGRGKKTTPKAIVSIIDRDGNSYSLDEQIENDLPDEQDPKNDDRPLNPFHMSLRGEQVYDRRLSYIMTNLLRGVIQHGTGRAAKNVSSLLGGKTGTTNNYVDAWFLGFSSNIVTGVWTGFDDNKTLGWGETGAKTALPIWKEFMRASLAKYGETNYQVPPGIINMKIDKNTGLPSRAMDADTFVEAFVHGTEPGVTTGESLFEKEQARPSERIVGEDEYYNIQ